MPLKSSIITKMPLSKLKFTKIPLPIYRRGGEGQEDKEDSAQDNELGGETTIRETQA